ncbi:McrC family protein [Actinokineospora fastidiosa]|uniref:McrBC 5-methylcytosine restriction system component n=1 Tax=Actinokineospora fastidiosa TaxID=1816 RepID=A0A918GPD5_9PSEU|nr:restriction endonuclease [Actinokineospora fastidiosa]GGS47048.1 McrBC 5-methylcytosine restriction system component [Actinokineospora fastidiosa]
MTHIEVGELGRSQHALTDAQGRALARSGVVTATPSALTPGLWEVAATGKVGVARVGDLDVWITPKLPIDRLLFLVGYAADPTAWRDDTVHLDARDGLIPAIGQALWRQTERALRQGLLQGYKTVEETSYVMRGRLREADQLRRHHGRVIPMELRHDDFTVDIPENRILLAALTRMLTVPRVDAESRRRIGGLRMRLAEVTSLVSGGRLPAWRPSRLNQRYVPALRLAEVVWRATSPEHALGHVPASGFLFDLPKVFEAFVTVAMGERLHAAHGGRAEPQFPCHLDEARTVRMKPDLVWFSGGRPAAVLDAKYKRESPSGYPNADLYQLLAYCTTLGLARGHLVYAKGAAEAAVHRIGSAGVRIHCHALDLTLPPPQLLDSVNRLTDAIAADADMEPTIGNRWAG